jgi:hypothetical protein
LICHSTQQGLEIFCFFSKTSTRVLRRTSFVLKGCRRIVKSYGLRPERRVPTYAVHRPQGVPKLKINGHTLLKSASVPSCSNRATLPVRTNDTSNMTGQTRSNRPIYTYTLTTVNYVTKLVIERKLVHTSGIKPTRNFGLTFVIDAGTRGGGGTNYGGQAVRNGA